MLWVFVLVCGLVAATTNPYADEPGTSFWDDVQTVHRALLRQRIPQHGASRPFFEAFTNALSDAEKAAFDRLHQGLPPDSSMEIEDVPTNVPLYLKPCDESEMDGQSGPMIQLKDFQMSLDPKHVKVRLNVVADTPEDLGSNLIHHTVVTVEGVSLAGFEMSPMVLYDLTGPLCELYDNMLGCPLAKGEVKLERKVKIPGLDAVTSMPKRLYNAQIKLLENDRLLSCMHLFMDMRADEERAKNPTPGVIVVAEPSPSSSPSPSISESPSSSSSPSASLLPTPSSPEDDQHLMDALRARMAGLFSSLKQNPSALDQVLQQQAQVNPGAVPVAALKSKDKVKTPEQAAETVTQDTALLQQLQLKNLQEQLKRQEEINKKQQVEFEKLKEKLAELQPSEVSNLKKTVNELLAVQKAKQDELIKEEEHRKREAELYQQLHHMYQAYNLPASTLPVTLPAYSFATDPSRYLNEHLPDLQFLSQQDALLKPAESELSSQSQPQSAQEIAAPAPAPVPETSENTATASRLPSPDSNHDADPSLVQTGLDRVLNPPFAAEIAGNYASKVEPLQIPNPNIPTAQYRSGDSPDPGRRIPKPSLPASPAPVVPSASPSPSMEPDQDADLPDVDNILASSPKYTDHDYGVSYVNNHLESWVRQLCQPFVTLASGLSVCFCVPMSWQGQTAIVITEPFTAEKGIFADLISITAPHQKSALNNTDAEYYAPPKYVGMNDLLLKHNYATIVVTFNPDKFIANLPFYTTEIMGSLAAFVDYAGEPTMTVVTGVGWGGVLAAQVLERHGGCRLLGGIVLDSPIGSARWQGDYYGDLLSLFNWVSPRAYRTIMKTRDDALSHLLLESWEEVGRPYVYQALTPVMEANNVTLNFTSPRDLKMIEMLGALNIKCAYKSVDDDTKGPEPQCLYDEVANAIRKAALYIGSYRLAFGGQDPYDNYRTLYMPKMFPHLNEDVSRKLADEAPLNHQSRYLDTSGLLRVPLIVLTTPQDPEVPGWQAEEYLHKQAQICESSGVGMRVINDTLDEFYGHAHADTKGKAMSEQLDILYSIIRNMRSVDDVALTQRSWVKAPLKMVDPELAECPFQGYWYRDMVTLFRAAVRNGRLPTNNKIQEMLGNEPARSPFAELGSSADVYAKNAAQTANNLGNLAKNGIRESDAVLTRAGFTPRAVSKGVDTVAGATGEAMVNAATQSQETAGSAAKTVGEAVGSVADAVAPPRIAMPIAFAQKPPSQQVQQPEPQLKPASQDPISEQIAQENMRRSQKHKDIKVPSYSEAMEEDKTPAEPGVFGSKAKYQMFLDKIHSQEPPPPVMDESWTEGWLRPIQASLSHLSALRNAPYSVLGFKPTGGASHKKRRNVGIFPPEFFESQQQQPQQQQQQQQQQQVQMQQQVQSQIQQPPQSWGQPSALSFLELKAREWTMPSKSREPALDSAAPLQAPTYSEAVVDSVVTANVQTEAQTQLQEPVSVPSYSEAVANGLSKELNVQSYSAVKQSPPQIPSYGQIKVAPSDSPFAIAGKSAMASVGLRADDDVQPAGISNSGMLLVRDPQAVSEPKAPSGTLANDSESASSSLKAKPDSQPQPLMTPNEIQNVLAGTESIANAFNRMRHSKLPSSVLKPFATDLIDSSMDDNSFVNRLGKALEFTLEKKLGMSPPTNTMNSLGAPAIDTGVFEAGRSYQASIEAKRQVLQKLNAVPSNQEDLKLKDYERHYLEYLKQQQEQQKMQQVPQIPVAQPQAPLLSQTPLTQSPLGHPQLVQAPTSAQPQPLQINTAATQGTPQIIAAPSAVTLPSQPTAMMPTAFAMPQGQPMLNMFAASQQYHPLQQPSGLHSQFPFAQQLQQPQPLAQSPSAITDVTKTIQTLDAALGQLAADAATSAVESLAKKISGKSLTEAATETKSSPVVLTTLQENFDAKMNSEMSKIADSVVDSTRNHFGDYAGALMHQVLHPGKIIANAFGVGGDDSADTNALAQQQQAQLHVSGTLANNALPVTASVAAAVSK